jgi:hypothetical protein
MGGFFLSSSTDAVNKAKAFFTRQSLPFRTFLIGGFQLLLLQKKFSRDHQNWHALDSGELAIAGAGFWLTQNSGGVAALREIHREALEGRNPFQNLLGHACFVFSKAGQVAVVTDRTGTYPCYGTTTGNEQSYSSSLLALAEVLPSLRFDNQSVREFVNVEAVLGENTLFQEIRSLPPGSIVTLDNRTGVAPHIERYYNAEDFPSEIAELKERLIAYVGAIRHAGFTAGELTCDLSGGYDSRTVAALVHVAGLPHTLNTNVNSADPGDHLAALSAAERTGRPIVLYNHLASGAHEPGGSPFEAMDLARNVFGGRLTLHSMQLKGQRHNLVLGGYGGELFRDVHSRSSRIETVIESLYCRGLKLPEGQQRDYTGRLRDKFSETLRVRGFREDERTSERIYLFEKMRAWGGTRIGLFNRYTHHWHPLLDHAIQRHVLTIPIERKKGAALQREIIELDAELAKCAYTGTKKQRMNSKKRTLIARVSMLRDAPEMLKKKLSPWLRKPAQAPKVTESARAFGNLVGVSLGDCIQSSHRERYLTLVEAFERYGSKLSS